jgi:hypothetical protein
MKHIFASCAVILLISQVSVATAAPRIIKKTGHARLQSWFYGADNESFKKLTEEYVTSTEMKSDDPNTPEDESQDPIGALPWLKGFLCNDAKEALRRDIPVGCTLTGQILCEYPEVNATAGDLFGPDYDSDPTRTFGNCKVAITGEQGNYHDADGDPKDDPALREETPEDNTKVEVVEVGTDTSDASKTEQLAEMVDSMCSDEGDAPSAPDLGSQCSNGPFLCDDPSAYAKKMIGCHSQKVTGMVICAQTVIAKATIECPGGRESGTAVPLLYKNPGPSVR